MSDREFVTNRQWDGYARRIERENLRERGESPTSAAIARRANSFILEIQDDRAGMLVKPGWREAMKGVREVELKLGGGSCVRTKPDGTKERLEYHFGFED